MEVKRVDLLREELLKFHEKNFKPSWAKLSREIGINSTTLSRIRGGANSEKTTLDKIEFFLNNNDYDHLNKKCNSCGVLKSRDSDNFQRVSSNKDGFDNKCKKCRNDANKENNQKYYQENKDEMLENNKIWLESNKEKRLKNKRDYYKRNRERQLEYTRIWQRKNPEKMRMYFQIRKARVNNLPHTLTEEEWKTALMYFDNSCAYCRTHQDELDEVLNQEHVIPVYEGGGYVSENIIPACKRCNSSKNARRFEEWYPEQEYFSEESMGKIINYIEN